jgi:hypothetical protein
MKKFIMKITAAQKLCRLGQLSRCGRLVNYQQQHLLLQRSRQMMQQQQLLLLRLLQW